MTRTRISLAAARTALWTAAAGAVQICPDWPHFVHTWPRPSTQATTAPCRPT
ncbi:MAG TPA: hypothetical protein VMH82_05260 [Myxococcota bacterium]|nr:hypothetical protein [Myxococcota bacterium]